MQTVLDILLLSTTYLREKGVSNSRRQAEELLCDALKVSRLQLYLDFERPLNPNEIAACREKLGRRGRGEPLPYIHGEKEFYGCSILVNSEVLIPRPETEVLVDKVASYLSGQDLQGKRLWDLCCGSGCIGIALKKKFPALRVSLSDISSKALQIAEENAKRNQVEVQLLEGDLLHPFEGQKAHFVICNPPYIAEHEYGALDREVRDYEPRLALVGGVKGIEFYERLARSLPAYLHPAAAIWFEIGYQQGEAIKALFEEGRWKERQVEKDWSGHDRFFFLENE